MEAEVIISGLRQALQHHGVSLVQLVTSGLSSLSFRS